MKKHDRVSALISKLGKALLVFSLVLIAPKALGACGEGEVCFHYGDFQFMAGNQTSNVCLDLQRALDELHAGHGGIVNTYWCNTSPVYEAPGPTITVPPPDETKPPGNNIDCDKNPELCRILLGTAPLVAPNYPR